MSASQPDSAPALAGDGAARLEGLTQRDGVRLFLSHWRGSLSAITAVTLIVSYFLLGDIALTARLAWIALAIGNYAAQAAVCKVTESDLARGGDGTRQLPWLQTSIAVSGIVWGLVPWMLPRESANTILLVTLLNLMLIFTVANAPALPRKFAAGMVPIAVLTTGALLLRHHLVYHALGAMALFALIYLYGVRVQSAILATMAERNLTSSLYQELAAKQQRLVELEHERTLLVERQRLMREMHDGLGSALVSSLSAIERGTADVPEIAAMLRDCLDDLRVVIDSLEPTSGDIVELLANLRFRLGRRLEAAGIRLVWRMEELPALAWIGPPEALQVMRIVQETLSNSVRHSKAAGITVTTASEGDHVVVLVVDDGCGFDPAVQPPGRGIPLLHQRAERLGAILRVDSAPLRGTSVRLELPIERPARRAQA